MRPSDLTPDRWRRIDRLLEAALDLDADQRDRFLAQECAADGELRSEVEALIDAHDRAGSLFDEPASLPPGPGLAPPGSTESEKQVGPFRILREIGRGGMGVVYLAEDTRLGRYVALKALPPYLGVGRDAKRRFRAEARAVSALDHPNIATLHAIDETDEGQLYMVFAFYDGETLDQRIGRGPLPIDEAIAIATGIAHGLGAAHGRQIVHRDVKPSNVLLTRDGRVKLLDFGVAKVAGEDLTGEGVRLGTVAYMSPEQAGVGPLDGRADLWSLGVVLYEMLTGSRPFQGDDTPATLQAVLYDEPEPPAALRSGLPDALGRVVEKLLSKTPDGRYQSTDDLLEDLRAVELGEAPLVATREPPPTTIPRVERLAVLPLADRIPEPRQAHLVHGIHEALIAELGRVRALGVISRTSTMRFRDTELSIPEIAGALDVDAVVEGSVARSGDELVITVQLMAAFPERQLWTGTYRRGMEGVLDVAAEVSRAIAAELGITLSPTEEDQLKADRQVDPEAYDAYNLGLVHMERRSPEGLVQAQKYLRRAIAIDPDFAPAYAVLSEAVGSAAFFGAASPAEALPPAKAMAQKALALDPNLAAAHTSIGAITLFGDWDWASAEESLRRAIALNPSYAYAYFILAETLSTQGRYDEAMAAARKNAELEKLVPFTAIGTVLVLLHMREYDEAIARTREGLEFFSEFWQGHWLLARALAGKELYGEAIEAAEAAAATSGRMPLALGTLGFLYAQEGRRDDALQVLAELEQRAGSEYVGASNFALIHTGLGNIDRAFEWLERAYEGREMPLFNMLDDAIFDPLRDDTRFDGLLQKIGLKLAAP
jgi:serine/threonine protein kinase/tetratricopeptide (TPR) repeat protein